MDYSVIKFKNKSLLLSLLLLFVFIILFVFPRLYLINRPFDRDEGEYAYSAWIMRQGIMPYENSFLQKPPMIVYTYFLGQLISDTSVAPPRVILLVAVLVSSLYLAKFATIEFGKKAFWLTLFVYNSILILPVFVPFSANCEYFMLVPMSVILYLYAKHKTTASPKLFFWVGVLYALAVLFKPLPILVLGYVISVWLVEIWKTQKNTRRILLTTTSLVIGFLITTLTVFLPFILSGSLGYVIESSYLYNILYINYHGFSLQSFSIFMYVFFLVMWILYFVVLFYVISRPTRWWFYTATLAISLASVYQSKFAHYYLLTTPFLTLITVQSVILLAKSKLIKSMLGKAGFAIVSALIVLSIFSFTLVFTLSLPYENFWKAFGDKPLFDEAKKVAVLIDTITGPDDTIYIVGTEPQIYFYAKRRSASRFVLNTVLEMDTPKRFDYQKQVIEDITRDQPKVIIYSGKTEEDLDRQKIPKDYYNFISTLLENKYEIVGGYVENNTGDFTWSTNLIEKKLGQGSMFVYTRRK